MKKLLCIILFLLFLTANVGQAQFNDSEPMFGQMLNVGHWATDGLVFYWRGIEAGEAVDESFFGNNGTLLGPTWAGQGLDFDGINDDVLLGRHSKFLGTSATQPFTVIVWAKADVIPAVRDGIISSLDNATGAVGWDLRLENGGLPINGAVFSIAGNRAGFTTADFIETDWNQYVGRFDGSNIEIFVNSILGTTSSTGTINGTNRNIYLGANFFPGTPGSSNADRWFDGQIREVSIYNRALSASEIQQLYINPDLPILDDPIWLMYSPPAVGDFLRNIGIAGATGFGIGQGIGR